MGGLMTNIPIDLTPAEEFFDEALPYHVNRVEESFALHLHAHEFTEISYVGEGSGFHYIGEERMPVSRGELFILPLGTSHVFRPRSPGGDPLVVYNFIFMPARVAEALQGFPGLAQMPATLRLLDLEPGPAVWRRIADSSGVFHTFFTNAYQEFRQRRTGFIPRMHGLFLILLTEIERHLEQEQAAAARPAVLKATGPVGEAVALIRSGYASAITAGDAARAFKLSERHFHRLFAQETGVTFNRYLQNVRIERGCELLRSTRMTLPEIAEAVGYQDKGYFVKLFKQKMGRTPRAYRKFVAGAGSV